ncbi:hypothetical protein NPIL_504021 [Nephila pilipes]|uniref:Uncharacterized protein n=1 Tax=Nephila pilipes TaxID=299642 RepID=A0A8X6TM44_NEPPI|nr:hypothetical protein NPIL_283861 [Nephila pilipes]GFT22734.1 hypothetical protein NPIL_504021 [Nephila pilipes]
MEKTEFRVLIKHCFLMAAQSSISIAYDANDDAINVEIDSDDDGELDDVADCDVSDENDEESLLICFLYE